MVPHYFIMEKFSCLIEGWNAIASTQGNMPWEVKCLGLGAMFLAYT